MKGKKKVTFQDDVEKKQKQVSRTKKKHLLKQESQMKNGKLTNKWQGKSGMKFKKPKKLMKGKSFGENDSGLKPRPDRKKKNKKNLKPGKTASKQLHSKFQKKTGPQLNQGPKGVKPTILEKGKKRKAEEANLEGKDGKKEEGVKKIKLCEMKPKERKKLRKQKKNTQAVFDMSMAAKKIWEVLRRDDCGEEKKKNLVSELLKLIKGHIKQLVFAHDTVRVIECIVVAGSPEQRTEVFDELKEDIVSVAKSKYAKFILLKILNYGTKVQKDFIMSSFKGNVVALVKHSEAAAVVELAFNDYANARQRSELIQEFYGPTFTVFKDEDARNLDDILLKHPEQKTAILTHVKDTLLKITEKTVIRHSIVHHVLREFMTHADAESRAEVIESIRDAVAEILHTKDGARVAMNCVWHGTVKDRKKIVKSMKMHVCKIAKEEHGSLMLIAVFDSVDDVKLIQQVIISKLCENFEEMAEDKYARKVLLYMVCPRDSHYFHPDVVNILKAGDNNDHTKKPAEIKRAEIREAASPLLLKQGSEQLEMLVKTNSTCTLLLGILQNAAGNRKEVLERISSLFLFPYQPKSGNDLHPLEQPQMHFLIKKLLQNEVAKETSQDDVHFSVVLTTCVPESSMRTWVECNRGAFILLDLLKCGIKSVINKVIKVTNGQHGVLKSKNYKGAELLLAELKKHSGS